MKSIMSVNVFKFMPVSPKRLVELIKESKYTKGVEVYLDCNKEDELKYLDDLVYELYRNDLILQIHGDVEWDYDKQLKFVKKLEEYSSYLGYPIVYTLHTIYDEDLEASLSKTIDYISKLLSEIDESKITVCLENLNCVRGYTRLNKEGIKKYVINDEKLYFTYDIGHVIADYGNITDLDVYMMEDVRNVHIHSHDGMGNDHMPIYKEDTYWNSIMKGLTFLILNNYQYNIVYEYDLNFCRGDSTEDRIKDYLASIDYVSQKYASV